MSRLHRGELRDPLANAAFSMATTAMVPDGRPRINPDNYAYSTASEAGGLPGGRVPTPGLR